MVRSLVTYSLSSRSLHFSGRLSCSSAFDSSCPTTTCTPSSSPAPLSLPGSWSFTCSNSDLDLIPSVESRAGAYSSACGLAPPLQPELSSLGNYDPHPGLLTPPLPRLIPLVPYDLGTLISWPPTTSQRSEKGESGPDTSTDGGTQLDSERLASLVAQAL